MANEEALKTVSYKASADLSTYYARFVKLDSNGRIAAADAAGAAVGVLLTKPSAIDLPGCVAIGGKCPIIASEAITAGAPVSAATGGKAQVAASGEQVLGWACEAAATDGEEITIQLQFRGKL